MHSEGAGHCPKFSSASAAARITNHLMRDRPGRAYTRGKNLCIKTKEIEKQTRILQVNRQNKRFFSLNRLFGRRFGRFWWRWDADDASFSTTPKSSETVKDKSTKRPISTKKSFILPPDLYSNYVYIMVSQDTFTWLPIWLSWAIKIAPIVEPWSQRSNNIKFVKIDQYLTMTPLNYHVFLYHFRFFFIHLFFILFYLSARIYNILKYNYASAIASLERCRAMLEFSSAGK